jgi:hypothetical protein
LVLKNASSNFKLPPRNQAAWESCYIPTSPGQSIPLHALTQNIIVPGPGSPLRPFSPPLSDVSDDPDAASFSVNLIPPTPGGRLENSRILDAQISATHFQTAFDREAPGNRIFTASRDRTQNIDWTNLERKKAEAGYIVRDSQDLSDKVSIGVVEHSQLLICLPASCFLSQRGKAPQQLLANSNVCFSQVSLMMTPP